MPAKDELPPRGGAVAGGSETAGSIAGTKASCTIPPMVTGDAQRVRCTCLSCNTEMMMVFTALLLLSSCYQISEPATDASLTKGVDALREGRVEAAASLLDQVAQSAPELTPHLWQRGIAHYFAGNYCKAREQFEAHRKVNPNDVENATWHFLCVTETDGVAEARRAMLAAPGDPRVPMRQIYALYAGTGDHDAVQAAVDRLPPGSRARRTARFYADLYTGLLAHAEGDAKRASSYLEAAAKATPRNVMVDVARLARDRLTGQKPSS